TARLNDRVERGVRDEVIDPLAHHGPGALAVPDHLHTTALELLGQVPGAGIQRLVVVVVDIDRLVVKSWMRDTVRYSLGCRSPSPFNGGKLLSTAGSSADASRRSS